MSRVLITRAASPLTGEIRVPGDKSVSIRRVLCSLFVDGDVTLASFGTGDDCQTALACLNRLGKHTESRGDTVVIRGAAGCKSAVLDCRNSATTARLLMGILAGHDGEWEICGDESLSKRPMERVAIPLREMGAKIELTDGHLPAKISGARLRGIEYDSPVASAQVKSAVLLAAMTAQTTTRYREPLPTRDHSERLLGLQKHSDGWIALSPDHTRLSADTLNATIPGDPSSSAFWIAAALLIPDSTLHLPNVLCNPNRIAFIELLASAGATISLMNQRLEQREEVADICVEYSVMRPFTVRQPLTALVIDEIPILAVLSTKTNGKNEFADAGELRLKESDRLTLLVSGLRKMGAYVERWDDGFSVNGDGDLRGGEIDTAGDHRMAMAFGIAGLIANGTTTIPGAECVSVSFPRFWMMLEIKMPGCIMREA